LGERWNPVLTRRAAGPDATDADRAQHLLHLMALLAGDDRQASWLEVVALAAADGTPLGAWEGVGDPWPVAHSYDPRGVPEGFWVPALMPPDVRAADGIESHWRRLRTPVHAAVERLLRQPQG
jgi:inosine/xanthosine triphosphate pyrophosphatase family protein